MTRKKRRLYTVLIGMAALGIAAALVLTALRDEVVFFYSPTELAEKSLRPDMRLRIGGLVEEDSVRRAEDGLTTNFRITDLTTAVPITVRSAPGRRAPPRRVPAASWPGG